MTNQKQELYNIIEDLPEELSNKVIDYVEYLKFSYIISNAPEELIIKNKEDLREKIKEGIQDTDNGNVCSIDEAFAEVKEILAN